MVSAINSVNKYPVNREMLEVTRRLQSLGYAPSGNLAVDRQMLQSAEVQKRQTTLASNSEVNLSKLQGTHNDFSATINNLDTMLKSKSINSDQENGLVNIGEIPDISNLQYKMVGASQVAELNKLRLGLIA